jgi:hypothetical protein
VDIRNFVRWHYLLCGASLQEAGSDLDLVEVGPEAAMAMHGPWARPYQILLAFSTAAAEANPEADLVEPGSFRLSQIIANARQHGRLAKCYLPPIDAKDARDAAGAYLAQSAWDSPGYSQWYLVGEGQEWVPFLCLPISVAQVGVNRDEELLLPAVNLVSGELRADFSPFLPSADMALDASPGKETRKRLSYKRAYQLIMEYAGALAGAGDLSWAQEATERYRTEVKRLEDFYRGLEKEITGEEGYANALAEAKRRRLEEQMERFSPRVLIRPCAAAIVYCPVSVMTGVVTRSDGASSRVVLEYDAVRGNVRERELGGVSGRSRPTRRD